MYPKKQNKKERKTETVSKMKRSFLIIFLIVVLMLMCIIPTIILISTNIGNPEEIAEIDKDNIELGEEVQASVAAAGQSITIEEDGVYRIRLHGGHGAEKVTVKETDTTSEEKISGSAGARTTGYIVLNRGDILTTATHNGGAAASNQTYSTKGGSGISVLKDKVRLGYASGGPGCNVEIDTGVCSSCNSLDWDNYKMIYEGGTASDFEEIINKSSTASAGTSKTITVSTDKESWCSKNDKTATYTEKEQYITGGGGGSIFAGGPGSYGQSAWEQDPVISFGGNTWNVGSICLVENGKADDSIVEDITKSHITVEKANLTLFIDPNGGTWNSSSSVSKKTALIGYTETISNPTRAGYVFTGWTVTGTESKINGNQFTMGTQDAVLKANWSASSASYQVRHWKQNVDGKANVHDSNNYTLQQTEKLTAGLNAQVTPAVKSATDYPGFISPATQTKTVTADGKMVVDYYYARKSYQVTLNKGTGIDTVTGGGTYLYGEMVTINATMLPGFQWSSWTGTNTTKSQSYSFEMPNGNATYTANGAPTEYTITYNLDDGTVNGKNPETFTADTAGFTLINPTKVGYTFTGWTGTNGSTPQRTVTITKGSTGNRNYTANWVANENTPYKVRHWLQNLNPKTEAKNEQNYTIAETEELMGTTNTSITPGTKTYEGFTAPDTQRRIILADGSLIVDYYYTRNKYTVTLNQERGVAAVLGAGEYSYGQEVTINVMVKAGYDWVKWQGDEDLRDLKVTFTMPAKNVEYTTVTMANPNTKYTIQHWKQKVDGRVDEYNENSYELADTDVLTGETDSMISPKTRTYEGFVKPSADGISVPITGEGTLLIKYYYTRDSYEVKLNKGQGIEEVKSRGSVSGEKKDSYLYGEEVTIEATTKQGYSWSKWTGPEESTNIAYTFTMGTQKVEYTANATPNNTPYKVRHWQQKLTGIAEVQNEKHYTLVDTDTDLAGMTDSEVTPRVKDYIGFTAPKPQTVIVLGDGSLVVDYYYTRSTNIPFKVEHWIQNLDGEKDSQDEQNYTKKETDQLEGTTGASVTPQVKNYPGFTAPRTQTAEVLGDGSLVVKYYYTRNTNTPYKVRHWVQKLEGMADSRDNVNYEIREEENLAGITGASITPQTKVYEGFTAPYTQTTTIEGDGTTEINYYYTRNTYTVSLGRGEGIENVIGANLYLYGEKVEIDTTVLPGYTWSKWTGSSETTTQNYIFVMPAENLNFIANATPNTNTPYEVRHWQQNIEKDEETRDEDNYTLVDTDKLTGTTGASVTPETKQYVGFIAPQKQTAEILGSGRLIVNYYYTRRTDLTCTVKHIEKATGTVMEEQTLENQTFEKEISAEEHIKEFEEYRFESSQPETLKIGLEENAINIYYVKKEGKVIVHHYIYNEKEDKYTTTKLVEDNEIDGIIGDTYKTTPSSDIPANYVVVNATPENFEGQLNGGTIEVTYYYKLKTPEIDSGVGGDIISGGEETEDGKIKVKAGEEVKYKIRYNTQIEEYKGKLKIEVKAELPEGTEIDETKCNFAEGTYDKATNTIKWTKEIEEINTFENGSYTEEIEKDITIVYAKEYVLDSIELEITGKTIVYYPKDETGGDGEEDKPLVEDEKDENGKVIVHHYIYDVEENQYTTKKLVEDEEIIRKVGKSYTTNKSMQIPENYRCINETPENYEGKITKEPIEVNYYYELKMPETDNKTETDIIEGGEQDSEGNWVIKAGKEIKYKVSYESRIQQYKGKADIEIKAKLPEGTQINQTKCNFAGGTYDTATNTIIWTKEIENINTFVNGQYTDKITKDITIVYSADYTLADMGLKVTGNTKLYYPDDYIEKGDESTISGGQVTVHHYVYEEKENRYTTVKVAPDEEIMKKVGDEYTTSKSKNIPENYICINDKPEGYKGTVTKEPIEVNYYYKLKLPTIGTVTGGETIEGGEQTEDGKLKVSAGEEIKYKIKYKTEIEDYKGRATIEIKVQLAEGKEIDESKCNFAGGTYDKTTNTITWIKEIENIDTYAHAQGNNTEDSNSSISLLSSQEGTYADGIYTLEIEKDITIVYAEDYILEEITPKVTGKATLYKPNGNGTIIVDETDENGKVIVHHYIYDEKTDTYTKTKILENEEIKGEIGEDYTTTPSNKIPTNYECVNERPEGYTGKFTKETIRVDYYYKLKTPISEGETTGGGPISGGQETEDGKIKVKAGEEIKYQVSYKTRIQNYQGKVKIEVKAKLPEGTAIDLAKCRLAEGTYDKATNTITWVKEIEEIDTFTNGEYTETITKDITIVYAENYTLDDIELEIIGKTILYYPDDYPTGGDGEGNGTLTEDETAGNGKVIVHHYIYDVEEDKYTTTKVAGDEQIKDKIGVQYTTNKSSKVPANYECVNERPEGYEGTITKEPIEVSYYYKLKTPKTESEIENTIISGGNKDEDGNWIIKSNEEIKYKVTYKTKIQDYKGRATIETKAKLPEGTKIDETKCDFAEGTYDKATNTITWTKEVENIDTFANGEYTDEITKEITIVYAEDYTLENANLKVTGKVMLYYPDDYPIEKDEPIVKDETEEKIITGKVIVHHYIYDEEDDKYTTTKLIEDEEIEKEIGTQYETKVSDKIPANYTVVNKEPEGYKGTIKEETKEIAYYYKLIKTKVEEEGRAEIISGANQDENGNWVIKANAEAKYLVQYGVKIEDYIGNAQVTIVAKLPAEIDPSKSDLNGGDYDEDTNTITWVEKIENINTFENGTYGEIIEKEITVFYKEDVIGSKEIINLKVTGSIETYYPENYPDKGGATLPKDDDPNNPDNPDNPNNPDNPDEKIGKIIVKYVDVDTDEEIININSEENKTYGYEIRDIVGKQYQAKEKEIPYYVLVRNTQNTTGEVKEEAQTVTYYYRKLNFNIGIEKTIDTITLNGKNVKIGNKETAKLELKKDDIKTTEIIVKYKIKVTNKGELGGTSKVRELIPEGYELAYLPEYWVILRDGNLETNVDLEAGESTELDVVLRWENEENNLGAKTNIAKIQETKNSANFKDTNEKDDIGEATIVLSIKTGETVSTIIIVMIMGSLVICSYITIKTIRRKDPEMKEIKFLNK